MNGISEWIGDHGLRLVIILGAMLALYFILHRSLPFLIKRGVRGRNKHRTPVEIDERASTITIITLKISDTLVVIAGLVAVLVEVGVGLGVTAQQAGDWFAVHGVRIIVIVVIAIMAAYALRRLLPVLIRRTVCGRARACVQEDAEQRAKTLSNVLVSTAIMVLGVVVFFTVLAEVGINIAPALAGFGIVGIAVGFGAQSMVKDLIAGLFILLENQYAVGDVVRIAGTTGVVQEISMRRTVLRDLDGIVHSIPNGEVSVASNFTKEWSRVNLNIRVSYGEDLDHVIHVINRLGKEMADEPYWGSLMLTPPQVLRVDAFEDSGIAIKILGDSKPMKQWEIMGELRKRLKKRFDEEEIEIPWPHTKVFFGEPRQHRKAKEDGKAQD